MDTKGKLETPSIHGYNRLVTIVEDYTCFVTLRSIRSKADTVSEVLRFLKSFEKRSGQTVLKVHTDGSTELRRALDEADEAGVQLSETTSHTPESKRLAEQTHHTCVSLARACLQHSMLSAKRRIHAIQHVAYCMNLVPGNQGKPCY